MESLTWKIGKITIRQIVEIEAGDVIQEVIPGATKENISKISWLRPHFADREGNLKALVQAFVIETGNSRIVVDTCVGNSKTREVVPQWGSLQTNFLNRFEQLGYSRNGIDMVLCTHLHFDHVGWNTMLIGGKWMPTFPTARYLFAKEEFLYWKGRPQSEIEDDHAGFVDSVLPVFEAGLVDLIPTDHVLTDGISLIPTPGHTPAHVSVLITSGGEQAVITGDALHHPCQMAHPDWEALADTDKDMARRSRLALFERFTDSPVLIIGSHFASPTAGHVRRDGDAFRFFV